MRNAGGGRFLEKLLALGEGIGSPTAWHHAHFRLAQSSSVIRAAPPYGRIAGLAAVSSSAGNNRFAATFAFIFVGRGAAFPGTDATLLAMRALTGASRTLVCSAKQYSPLAESAPAGVGWPIRWQRSMKCSWLAARSLRSALDHFSTKTSGVILGMLPNVDPQLNTTRRAKPHKLRPKSVERQKN